MSKTKVKRIKMSPKERIIIVIAIIVALSLIFGVVKFYLKRWVPLSESNGSIDEGNKSYALKVEDESLNDDGLDLNQKIEGQFTILCLGFDEQGENTDVIMLVQCDIKNKKINILQIPRDTYVGGSTTGKLNSVYANGDKDLTPINRVASKIEDITGIPIDRYMAINCNDIPPVVDAMGGIPINVPETIVYEADKIIKAGEQTLTGEQSEWFVRFRHDYTEGDIGRVKAQRIFLAAAMSKLKDMGSLKFISIFPTIQQYIMSDMSLGEIGSLADFAQTVSMKDVTARMLPGESLAPGDYNGYYIWTIHADELADMLNEYFRPYQADMSADELDIIQLRNSESYYDEVVDNFEDISSGDTPSIPRKETSKK